MAKILMMAGSTVVVLSLLGFLVLLLKGRAVTKTSPVLMSLKALGIRPSEAEQRLCRQRHCCKVSDEAAFCLIQRPYISKTLLTRRISPRGSP